MPSLRISHPASRKSFREMEKIDRIAQHGDYLTLLSYSPRKQAAARTNARLYRLPICYSIKQITGMQFKVVPSQSRLHEFRAISHVCVYMSVYRYIYIYTIYIYMHVYVYCVCLCVCVCVSIDIYYIYIYFIYTQHTQRARARVCGYPFPISLFRKSPFIHLARKCGCRATEIRRLRGFVCGEM